MLTNERFNIFSAVVVLKYIVYFPFVILQYQTLKDLTYNFQLKFNFVRYFIIINVTTS